MLLNEIKTTKNDINSSSKSLNRVYRRIGFEYKKKKKITAPSIQVALLPSFWFVIFLAHSSTSNIRKLYKFARDYRETLEVFLVTLLKTEAIKNPVFFEFSFHFFFILPKTVHSKFFEFRYYSQRFVIVSQGSSQVTPRCGYVRYKLHSIYNEHG